MAEKLMKRFWWIAGVIVALEVVGIIFFLLTNKGQNIDLLTPAIWWAEEKEIEKKMEVVGFLPTWMIGKTKLYGSEVTQLVFLGIEVKPDGSLLWDVQSKKINSDNYLKLKANITKTGGKNILGIKLFKDKELDQLIASDKAKKVLTEEVVHIVKAGGFDGVNIDFEYMSDPSRIMDDDFLAFMKSVKGGVWGEISVDVFANTVIKGQVDRLSMLLESVDKVIVMAYDFHRPGSDYAGPVAPIEAPVGKRSISEVTKKIVEAKLPAEKFIMAYPLYGYKWETIGDSLGSATMTGGYGATVLYKDPPSMENFGEEKWDEVSQTPWFAWTEKEQRSRVVSKKVGTKIKKVTEYYEIDQWHQAYVENEESLKVKIDLAKEAKVGGIGYWALGYEGVESNLIQELRNKVQE